MSDYDYYVSLLKLIMSLLIYFDKRKKGTSPLYIFHIIFGSTLGLLFMCYIF